jgi:hypothetical protein
MSREEIKRIKRIRRRDVMQMVSTYGYHETQETIIDAKTTFSIIH